MKFIIKYKDQNTDEEKSLIFNRTLGIEKAYRDELSVDGVAAEYARDLMTLLTTYQDFELAGQTPRAERTDDDRDVIAYVMSLEFKELGHNILKYAYARRNGDRLVQSEATREEFDELIESGSVPETEVLANYFKRNL